MNKFKLSLTSFKNKIRRNNSGSRRRKKTYSQARSSKLNGLTDFINGRSRVLLIIFLILFVILFGVNFLIPLVDAVANFQPRRAAGDEATVKEGWNGTNRLITLFIGLDNYGGEQYQFVDAITLFVLEPETNKVGMFAINPDIIITSSLVKDRTSLRTIFNNKNTRGREIAIIKDAVENLLAVKIDRYMIIQTEAFALLAETLDDAVVRNDNFLEDEDVRRFSQKTVWNVGDQYLRNEEFLGFLASDDNGRNDQFSRQMRLFTEIIKNLDNPGQILRLPYLLKVFSAYVQTDLSLQELVTMGINLYNIRSDQIRFGYTRASSLIKMEHVGVYDRYQPIIEAIDKDLESILFDFNIAKEQAQIEVLNGSEEKGLAANRSRWVTNAGGRIVHFGNSIETVENTQIFVAHPEKYPYTLRELERIFNDKVEYPGYEYIHKHVGDIIVVIGKNYQ